MNLQDKICSKKHGLLFYGITPPKLKQDEEKLQRIASKQRERIAKLDIDGLILYDIQDESSRIEEPRPFPYLPTLDPDIYSRNYLQDLPVPRIIYKSVGKYTPAELEQWLKQNQDTLETCVFVGSPSVQQQNSLALNEAYRIHKNSGVSTLLGGITIPERHAAKADEHLRLAQKMKNGCSFFVSQCVYNVGNAKDFLSDYFYHVQENGLDLKPIVFTLTPCGSVKTLEFMKWLGIDIPAWLKNELFHSEDILAKSVEICVAIATELLEFANKKNIPIGFNIESVSIRKTEIEASVDLLNQIKHLLNTN